MVQGARSLGVDVGGTFTDVVLVDGHRLYRDKAPTTHSDLASGILAGCCLIAEQIGMDLPGLLPTVSRFGLGTTAVTNVLASRRGRSLGLITTSGFEDLLVLARGRRQPESGWLVPPAQVVDRDRIMGVKERVDKYGEVIAPLDPRDVEAAGQVLVEERGAEALVVSFLWSIRNPKHEEVAVEALRKRFPDRYIIAASSLHPALREYDRTMFALLNAFVSDCFGGIDTLVASLRSSGLRVPVLLVHSAGGSLTADEARAVPLGLAQSGPAAGVAAARVVAARCGLDDAVACDMGGTSLDVSLIVGGSLSRVPRGDLMGYWTALPRIDVDSIGAGGGSIGWVDARGMLRVGPHSAGSEPGPACYARGGTAPTVTDALAVLGYLDGPSFLGGRMPLDLTLADQACSQVGRGIQLSGIELAAGLHQLTAAHMARAVRRRLAERGLDPRCQAVIAYGGCAGLFAAEIAARVGTPRVVVPEEASVLSAAGAATTQIRRERIEAVSLTVPGDAAPLNAAMRRLAGQLQRDLESDLVPPADRHISFEVDLRFSNQAWELAIPLLSPTTGRDVTERLADEFRAEYARRYGQVAMLTGVPIEAAAVRGIGLGAEVPESLRANGIEVNAPTDGRGRFPPPTGQRRLSQPGMTSDTVPVYRWAQLSSGDQIAGPALIDGLDTTVWVPSSAAASVDRWRAIHLSIV